MSPIHIQHLTCFMTNVSVEEHIHCKYYVMLVFYRSLTIEDQISLLKGATFEIMQIRFNMVFNPKTSIWECGHIKYCIDDATRGETINANKLVCVLCMDLLSCSKNVQMSR